jgi:tripartite-type tricarboxylate transporter receptor subunit TctC
MFKKILLVFVAFVAFVALSAQAKFDPTAAMVQVVIPYAPGGGPDNLYRVFERYAADRNIKIVPIHRPGAEGQIGAAYAATTKPDGHNLMLTVIADMAVGKQSDNFVPVSAVCQSAMYIVTRTDSKIKNLTELFAQMKQDPSKLSWANSSKSADRDIDWIARKHNSSLEQLVFTRFNKGGPTAVAGGHVDIGIWPASVVETLVAGNQLRVIGKYQTNDPSTAGIQSVEQVLGKMNRLNGFGIFLPAGTSTQVQHYWSEFVEQFKSNPDVQQQLREKFFTVFPPGRQVLVDIIDFNRGLAK